MGMYSSCPICNKSLSASESSGNYCGNCGPLDDVQGEYYCEFCGDPSCTGQCQAGSGSGAAAKTYTITLKGNGGLVQGKETHIYTKTCDDEFYIFYLYELPMFSVTHSDPTKRFIGWSRTANGPVITEDGDDILATNTTLYAIYGTLTDQTSLYVKVDGKTHKGIPYVRVNGTYKRGIKTFVKINGTWKMK